CSAMAAPASSSRHHRRRPSWPTLSVVCSMTRSLDKRWLPSRTGTTLSASPLVPGCGAHEPCMTTYWLRPAPAGSARPGSARGVPGDRAQLSVEDEFDGGGDRGHELGSSVSDRGPTSEAALCPQTSHRRGHIGCSGP